MIFNKSISEITKEDLESLAMADEGRHLEFKVQLNVKSEDEKIEFLADISSFANSAGGYIIYGIQEKRGKKPFKIAGIDFDHDSGVRQLESIMQTGLQPRLSTYSMNSIDIGENKKVLVIEIQPSWNCPHRVICRGDNRFYVRNSQSKIQPDVEQLRELFLGSEGIHQRIRDFRDSRISRVMARDTPVSCSNFPLLAIHVTPYSAFRNSDSFSIVELKEHANNFLPCGVKLENADGKINLDGLVLFPKNPSLSYRADTQVWRNGCVEAVSTLPINDKGTICISNELKKYIMHSYRFIEGFRALDINSSIVFFVSLLKVKNFSLGTGVDADLDHSFDRDVIRISDLVIENINEINKDTFKERLLPIFNEIANSAGLIHWK